MKFPLLTKYVTCLYLIFLPLPFVVYFPLEFYKFHLTFAEIVTQHRLQKIDGGEARFAILTVIS